MKLRHREGKKLINCSKIVSETYKDFAENTSIHGLKYTAKHEIGYYEKIFWVLIVLCGLCGSGYMTVLFWERYTSNPTRTTILTSYAPTTAIPFPAVTICNNNKIMLAKVESFIGQLDINDTEDGILRRAFPQLLLFTYSNVMDYNITELQVLQNVLENSGYKNTTFIMEKISQSCEEMLLYCVWNKKPMPCRDIFKESISQHGICCSFNYKLENTDALYTPFSGADTGIKVILDPMRQLVQYSPLYCSGFEIHIHSSTESLGPESNSKMLGIGRMLYLQIGGTKMTCSESVKSLSVSQRECLNPDEFTLKYHGNKYGDSSCFLECEHDSYFQQCGCVPYYFSFTDKPICDISKIPCLQEMVSKRVISKKMSTCNCLPQCENILYDIFSTSAQIIFNESISMMSFGDTNITRDTTILNVFFVGNTQTIMLKDTITSTIYLLSSFGGVYSLFMGCSLITIAEIIYYCFFRFGFKINQFRKVSTDKEYGNKRSRKLQRFEKKIQKSIAVNHYPRHKQSSYYNNVFLP